MTERRIRHVPVVCDGVLCGIISIGDVVKSRIDELEKDKRGIYRVPDPKILAGSNYADIGFELDPKTGRVVSLAAIDNLMKYLREKPTP